MLHSNHILIKSLFRIALFICFGLMVLFTSPAKAQVSTEIDSIGYRFWYSDLDARTTALANSLISDPNNKSGMYSNPSLIALNPPGETVGYHSGYFKSGVAIQNITARFQLAADKALMIGGTFHSSIDFGSELDENTNLNFKQYTFDLAYAQSFFEELSVGLRVRSYAGVTENTSLVSGNASIGVTYAPSPMLSYGIVYTGTGYQSDMLGSGLVFYENEADQPTQVIRVELPQRLELGTTLRFPSRGEYPDFILSFSNEKLFGRDGLVYRGGLEIYFFDNIIARGGYFYSRQVAGSRLGLGLLLEPLTLNYSFAFNTLDETGQAHQLSITINF